MQQLGNRIWDFGKQVLTVAIGSGGWAAAGNTGGEASSGIYASFNENGLPLEAGLFSTLPSDGAQSAVGGGFSLGCSFTMIKGSSSDFAGYFQNVHLPTPIPRVGVDLHFSDQHEYKGSSIGVSVGKAAAAATTTNTILQPFF